MSHTKGPWTVNGRYVNTSDATVAHVSGEGRAVTPEQAAANARLIATAPELLAALEVLINYPRLGAYERADAMIAAREAIKKATGRDA